MASFFDDIELAPADPILSLTWKFKADTHEKKVNLGVGAYRDDAGAPYPLPLVQALEKEVAGEHDHEYLPIEGRAEFLGAAARCVLGRESAALAERRVASCQSLSGTGALSLIAQFVRLHLRATPAVYISRPTWGNHRAVFALAGLDVREYRYWHAARRALDADGMLDDLRAAPERSVVVLHAVAHNPTGVDPDDAQWAAVLDVCRARSHFVLMDCAYQGFASGDLERDAAAIRRFADARVPMVVAQSFAKNLGMYGERIGAVHFVTDSADAAERVLSQVKRIVRPLYSNPPLHAALVVTLALTRDDRYAEWLRELKTMSGRIIEMRARLHDALVRLKTPGSWSHITSQIGMFSFTGLSERQVELLTSKYHIYLLKNGRISMAGLNSGNVDYVAEAIHDAVTSIKDDAE